MKNAFISNVLSVNNKDIILKTYHTFKALGNVSSLIFHPAEVNLYVIKLYM